MRSRSERYEPPPCSKTPSATGSTRRRSARPMPPAASASPRRSATASSSSPPMPRASAPARPSTFTAALGRPASEPTDAEDGKCARPARLLPFECDDATASCAVSIEPPLCRVRAGCYTTDAARRAMSEAEFREIAKRVSNWGRWGVDDERGALNLITPEVVKRAAGCVRRGRVFSLGLGFGAEGPQPGPGVPFNPHHYLSAVGQPLGPVNGLDFCYSDDVVHMPLQCATQWDALAHVHYAGQLYNGFRADEVLSTGGA